MALPLVPRWIEGLRSFGDQPVPDLGERGRVFHEVAVAAVEPMDLGVGDRRAEGFLVLGVARGRRTGPPRSGPASAAWATGPRRRGWLERRAAGARRGSVRCRRTRPSAPSTVRGGRGRRRCGCPATRCERVSASSGGTSRSSCSGALDPPAPPGDVQARQRRSTRSGAVTASSWATMPPKDTPNTRQVSQPTWSSRARASAARSAIVGSRSGSSGTDRPSPRWS